MKKNHALAFTLWAILTFAWPLFAAYYGPTGPTITIPGSTGQILFNDNGILGAVGNSYASTTGGVSNVNIGAYASYPNPNGMFNTYYESSVGDPVLGSSFMGSTTSYVQGVFVQNLATGGNASADIVIANDKGTATSSDNYLDLGTANTGQSDGALTLIKPWYGYLYNKSGPLLLGTGLATSTVISQGMTSTSSSITIDQYGRTVTKGDAPSSLSGCGTNPSVVGNDSNGVITLGTGISVTACTLNFAHSFPAGSTVSCGITTSSALATPSLTAVSTTGFTAGLGLSLASGKIYYQCMASQ